MKYLPILIDIRNQDILVVGGGHVAARKARGAERAGAKVTVLCGSPTPSMIKLLNETECRHVDAPFEANHLRGVRLAFVATEDEDLAKSVSRAAREASIPVNVADRTALCSFIMPATVDRHPIVIAVSSGGDAPILTRSLRARLETLLPADLGKVADFVGARRDNVSRALPNFDARRRFWDRFIEGPIPEHLSAGDETEAQHLFERSLSAIEDGDGQTPAGTVAIIGCGPGDPDMLTFQALRLMQQADIALAEADVTDGILERVRRDAEIFQREKTVVPVEKMASWVSEGKAVVRLGSGDFGRSNQGNQEAAILAEQHIKATVIRGVAEYPSS
ncbi:MAG: siroheme synthase [Rhodospirillaceae bacterium]|nr:siroheme synthase [Rhodospirillaceae bacterium]MBT6609306.1 siroheme synthase [Rhodospirillaceae bacterium]MBT7248478.1 siroheme synthase [Rhodospirillaceae bacterium]